MSSIAERIKQIKSSLPDNVSLVAVSKFHPKEAIERAYETGHRIFGESRVQELMDKQPLLPSDIEWHFIGTLQRNKVKYIVPFVHTIHSLDTVKLMHEIEKRAVESDRIINCLIQVHIAEEETKSGFSIEECRELFSKGEWRQCTHINFIGLMGMATFTDDKEQIKREFDTLKSLFDEMKQLYFSDKESFSQISMGMSDDYPIAIESGSTLIRVGSLIFGEREY